jgi:hypothetical protein
MMKMTFVGHLALLVASFVAKPLVAILIGVIIGMSRIMTQQMLNLFLLAKCCCITVVMRVLLPI